MSILKVGTIEVPAFSGFSSNKNKRAFACNPKSGPIPPGDYYVFDRQIAGLTATLRDRLFADQRDWFSLFAIDDNIDDDAVRCDTVMRKNLRLHPKQGSGLSLGCVTVDNLTDYSRIRNTLRANQRVQVNGSKFRAYAILSVL